MSTQKNSKNRKRYSLDKLLKNVTLEKMVKIKQDTAWFRESDKSGRELV